MAIWYPTYSHFASRPRRQLVAVPAEERLVVLYGEGSHEDEIIMGGGRTRPSRQWIVDAGLTCITWEADSAMITSFQSKGWHVMIGGPWAHAPYWDTADIISTVDTIVSNPSWEPAIKAFYLADEPGETDTSRPTAAEVQANHDYATGAYPNIPTWIAMNTPWVDTGSPPNSAFRDIPTWRGISHYAYNNSNTSVYTTYVDTTEALSPAKPILAIQKIEPDAGSPVTTQPTAANVELIGNAQIDAGALHLGLWTSEIGLDDTLMAALPDIVARWKAR